MLCFKAKFFYQNRLTFIYLSLNRHFTKKTVFRVKSWFHTSFSLEKSFDSMERKVTPVYNKSLKKPSTSLHHCVILLKSIQNANGGRVKQFEREILL